MIKAATTLTRRCLKGAWVRGPWTGLLLSHWRSFIQKIEDQNLVITGRNLDVAGIVAVARYGASTTIAPSTLDQVAASENFVKASLDKGLVVYGVNTGFGGSANTRTSKVAHLQRELIRMLNYGVLPERGNAKSPSGWAPTLPLSDVDAALSMPEAWVRAAMLARLSSLAKGASGVRITTLHALMQLLQLGITPQVPLRGSISASGDLSPLSYVAGVVMGKPTSMAWVGSGSRRTLQRADKILEERGLAPVGLEAKEGLAIVNGTAFSAGLGALAAHEMLMLAAVSEVLVAMSVEALCGTDESFDHFFADVRDHPGQRESASHIYQFLSGSKLVRRHDGSERADHVNLRQDRYSTRTASQWLGPCIEDIMLATRQISVELNSVTDNPLIDMSRQVILHGGNFQAKSVTSAMEKIRQAAQSIGRMLSTQCAEIINPVYSFGLPPNLVIDEPSEAFLWKGTDIMIAALQSELGFLANPVGTHVQTAEMGNQALNSLALISARYTIEAIEVLSQMTAAHLVALCQALDLRAFQKQFLDTFRPRFRFITQEHMGNSFDSASFAALQETLWLSFCDNLDHNTTKDSSARLPEAVHALMPLVMSNLPQPASDGYAPALRWASRLAKAALAEYLAARDQYSTSPDATPVLGAASGAMYRFVRGSLRVPFVSAKTPKVRSCNGTGCEEAGRNGESPTDIWEDETIGELVSKVYRSIRSGELYATVMGCVEKTAPQAKL